MSVILSGGLDDGTAGPWAVQRQGGSAVGQAPGKALHASMPRAPGPMYQSIIASRRRSHPAPRAPGA
ncbi:MAG TPA: chemotaxis protein CheB [Candidatus Tectomicrobia bacterium]